MKSTLHLLVIVYFITLGSFSCSNSEKEIRHKMNVTDQIVGENLKVKNLDGRSFIAIKDSFFIMNSFYNDSLVIIYDLKDNNRLIKVGSYIIKGNGPNEFNSISGQMIDEMLEIIDSHGQITKLSTVNIKSLVEKEDINNFVNQDLSWIKPFNYGGDFIRLNDSLLLLLGGDYEDRNLITMIDLNNKTKTPLNYWVEDSYNDVNIPKQMAYCSNSRVFKNKQKVLFASGLGRYLEILTLSDQRIVDRKLIYGFTPIIEKRNDNLNYKVKFESYRGMKVRTTNKYIYVRLKTYQDENGNQLNITDFKGYPYYYNDELEVYDWDGNFIRNYQTDIPFNDFIVTDNNQTLFIVSQDIDSGEPIIVKYRL